MVQNLHHAHAAQIIDQSAFLSLPSVNESFTCSIIFLGILGVKLLKQIEHAKVYKKVLRVP